MKKNLLLLTTVILGLTACSATHQVTSSNYSTDNVVLVRKGYVGSAVPVSVYVDNKLMGKVGGYRYLSFQLPLGSHEFNFKIPKLAGQSRKVSYNLNPNEPLVLTFHYNLLGRLKIESSNTLPDDLASKRPPKVQPASD